MSETVSTHRTINADDLERKSNKIIFLDIDGVLVTHRTLVLEHDWQFDPIGVRLLKKLMADHPGWNIVLSSTWRTMGNPRPMLLSHGLWYVHKDPMTPFTMNMWRGDEINKWLAHHPEVTDYIILDDEVSDLYENQMPFVVQTDPMNGITFENYLQIEKLMKGPVT